MNHPLLALLAYGWEDVFRRPMPVWDYWPVLLVPLVVAVAVVWKSIKCRRMSQVPWEASVISLWILLAMCGAAALLSLIVKFIES